MEQERKAAASTELSLEISFEDKFYFQTLSQTQNLLKSTGKEFYVAVGKGAYMNIVNYLNFNFVKVSKKLKTKVLAG